MIRSLIILVTTICSMNLMALTRYEESKNIASKNEINFQLNKSTIYKNLVSKNLNKSFQLSTNMMQPPSCLPTGVSCVDEACGRLASYKCDEMSEISDIANSCRGNYDGSCLAAVCNHMASYKCDEAAEVKEIASFCAGVTNGSCIDAICSRMASYKCDEISELQEVAAACKGY